MTELKPPRGEGDVEARYKRRGKQQNIDLVLTESSPPMASEDIDSEGEKPVNGSRGGVTCDGSMLQTILAEIQKLRQEVSELRADQRQDVNNSEDNDMLVLHLEHVHVEEECADPSNKAGVGELGVGG